MQFTGKVLNEEETKRIHEDSIRILEEVGVKVPLEKALAMLEQAGADVDYDIQVARISRKMVENALQKAPKAFTLGARNPIFDLALPSTYPVLNMDGCGSNTIDFRTGKRRLSTSQDLRDIGKVFDTIDGARVLWSAILPSDLPSGGAGVISTAISMLASGKHVQDEIKRIEELPFIIEICKAFAGDEQAVIDRKLYSVTYCTVAPLCHDEEMLEATMALSKYKVPILIYPMPACGSTGPAGLYSNVALANAESLSSMVIFQLTTPGTPLIYGAALGRISQRTGAFMEGAVETALQMMAMTQMGKHYGLPTMSAGCLTDANKPGMQAMMEKTLTTILLTTAGADIIQGIGLIESSMTMSLEQMIMDEEIYKNCMRMRQGIEVSDEKDYFEDIKKVAQGGHYLKQPSTRKAFRTEEFFNSKLIPGETYDTWTANGAKSLFDYAHERVAKILAADPVSPVDSNTENLVNEIIEEASAKL